MGVADGEVVDRCAEAGPVFDRGDLDVRVGARAEPLAGLEVGGVEPLAQRRTQNGWPSVAVTSAVSSPLSPSVSMTTLTRCFSLDSSER
ncbi:hypothetical protein BIU87_11190 [Streptomyces sp. ZS0098]|nr:hypothetical protein BIU87_11190 [Streptomyces sp. ZS0098]